MTINIQEFYDNFKKEYTFLYDNYDNVPGFSEAVEAFDNMLHNEKQKPFILEFVAYRQDIISSDREAAAFIFTLDSMTI